MSLVTKGTAPMPYEHIEFELVRETGWTLDYIRNELSIQDFNNWIQDRDARIKARQI